MEDGGDESGEGEEGTAGRGRGCLPATLGRVLGVVTVDVVVNLPGPARRRAGTVVVLARTVVVAVVTGRVLADVKERGRLVVVGTVVVAVTGLVLVEVTGRVWVEVVTGCVIVVAGKVPTPATGGRLNRFNALSTSTGYEMLKSSIS